MIDVDFKNRKVLLQSGINIKYDYLVGADGANSLVRKKMHKKIKSMAVGLQTRIPTVSSASSFSFYFNEVDYGYIWKIARNEESIIGYAKMHRKGFDYMKQMETAIKEIGERKAVDSIKGAFIPFGYYIKRSVKNNRAFLVGDAGGYVDAIFGEGIYYALKSGSIAAETIVNKRKNKSFLYRKNMKEIYKKLSQKIWVQRIFYFRPIHKQLMTLLKKDQDYLLYIYQNIVEGDKHPDLQLVIFTIARMIRLLCCRITGKS